MPANPAGPGSPAQQTGSPEETASDLEYANSARSLTVGMAGTSVAILTFALFFLYDRAATGVFDPLLFRLTVGAILGSVFCTAYSGTSYYWEMEAIRRGDSRYLAHQAWGGRFFVIGFLLLMRGPAWILFTARMPELGLVALILWLVFVAMLFQRSSR